LLRKLALLARSVSSLGCGSRLARCPLGQIARFSSSLAWLTWNAGSLKNPRRLNANLSLSHCSSTMMLCKAPGWTAAARLGGGGQPARNGRLPGATQPARPSVRRSPCRRPAGHLHQAKRQPATSRPQSCQSPGGRHWRTVEIGAPPSYREATSQISRSRCSRLFLHDCND